MRRTLTSITLLLGVAAWKTLGDAVGDFTNLQQQCLSVSNDLLNSVTTVNNTSGQAGVTITTQYNTAGALGGIAQSLATSQTSYQNNQVAFVNGQPQAVIDNAFLDYVNEILTLSNALITRGLAPHTEADVPVWDQINALVQAVHDYARGLTARTIISPSATIRSITAENSLDDAEVCWGRGAAASM